MKNGVIPIANFISGYQFRSITSDYMCTFGDESDGVIELVGSIIGKQGLFETGYYYGDTKPKPIVNISTMIGCPAKCPCCELGRNSFVRTLNANEMYEQVVLMLLQASRFISIEKKHKVNVAKSGEPLLNSELVDGLIKIGNFGCSFKISSILPDNALAELVFGELTEFASCYKEPVQLQVSLISTSEEYRAQAIGNLASPFVKIRGKIEQWVEMNPLPKGRKPNFSLILAEETPADPQEILEYFPPSLVNLRLREYVPTENGAISGLHPISSIRMSSLKKQFRDCGYNVSNWAAPTNTEKKFNLSANSTLERYRRPN